MAFPGIRISRPVTVNRWNRFHGILPFQNSDRVNRTDSHAHREGAFDVNDHIQDFHLTPDFL